MSSKWGYVRLGDVAAFKYGKFLAKSQLSDSGYPVFSGYGVVGYLPDFQFDHEQLLIVCRGEGGTGDVKMSPSKCSITNLSIVISPDQEKVDKKYLYWALKASDTHRLRTGSAQAQIVIGSLEPFAILLPQDRGVQRKVAQFLDFIEDRICLLRETNVTLEAIAHALFKSWFVDFDPVRARQQGLAPEGVEGKVASLFPDSFEDDELGALPKGWKRGVLADLATYQNGYAFKTKDWQDSGHPVVKIGNVKPGVIDVTGASCVSTDVVVGLDRFKLSRGDLLVGMTGYVGETGLVPTITPDAFLNQRVGRISASNGIADIGYAFCLVRNPAYKTYAESKAHGSAQANVSGTDLMAYPAVIPSKSCLDAFNRVLHPVIDQLLCNYDRAQTLGALRDALLPRLASGQLRLPDLDLVAQESILDEALV